MRQAQLCIIAGSAHKAIVHKFYAGGVQASLNQRRHKVNCLLHIGENSENIQAIGAQGQQLQGRFSDNTQGTLTAHYQLVQAVASGAFLQAVA